VGSSERPAVSATIGFAAATGFEAAGAVPSDAAVMRPLAATAIATNIIVRAAVVSSVFFIGYLPDSGGVYR
jgi:hypothetical protein